MRLGVTCAAGDGVPATLAVDGDIILEHGVLFGRPRTSPDVRAVFTDLFYRPTSHHVRSLHLSVNSKLRESERKKEKFGIGLRVLRR